MDAIHAGADAKTARLDEDTVIESFNKMRGFIIDFVTKVLEAVFENEKVVNQFNMELVGDLRDHNIPVVEKEGNG